MVRKTLEIELKDMFYVYKYERGKVAFLEEKGYKVIPKTVSSLQDRISKVLAKFDDNPILIEMEKSNDEQYLVNYLRELIEVRDFNLWFGGKREEFNKQVEYIEEICEFAKNLRYDGSKVKKLLGYGVKGGCAGMLLLGGLSPFVNNNVSVQDIIPMLKCGAFSGSITGLLFGIAKYKYTKVNGMIKELYKRIEGVQDNINLKDE